MSLEAVFYYLVLSDALFATVVSWSGYGRVLNERYGLIGRFLPIARGWTTYYLVLAIWLGIALARLGIIG